MLRNAVERTLGILKMRFPILQNSMYFYIHTHVKVVKALCCLHNFISYYDGNIMLDIQKDSNLDSYSANSGKLQHLLSFW